MLPTMLAMIRTGHSRPGRLRSAAKGTPVASQRLEFPSVECGNGMQKLATRNTVTASSGGKAIWGSFDSDRLTCLTLVSALLSKKAHELDRPRAISIHHPRDTSQHGENTVLADPPRDPSRQTAIYLTATQK